VSFVGDKLKFSRSRSLRGEGSQVFSTPQPQKPFKVGNHGNQVYPWQPVFVLYL